jgi:putative transposase
MKAYKYRIYPKKAEKVIIDDTIEHCRLLYNRLVEERKVEYEKSGNSLNKYTQIKTLPERKKYISAYNNIYSQVLQNVCDRVDKSYKNFFRRVKEGKGKVGYPRYQGHNKYNSFTYPQSGYSINQNVLTLSKIGKIKVELHREIDGIIKTCTIIRKNDKYYTCFSCEVEQHTLPNTGEIIGIDVGIKTFVAGSDGLEIENKKVYKKASKNLKHLQRLVSKKKKGSKRRKVYVKKLAKVHELVANQRQDVVNKAVHKLINNYDVIIHEDLKVKNMVKNHKLAGAISDVSWGKLFESLESAAKTNANKQIIKVNPRNTSKKCSCCGNIKESLKLSERTYNCDICGLKLDRDINAAINIKVAGIAQRGDGRKRMSMNLEAPTS